MKQILINIKEALKGIFYFLTSIQIAKSQESKLTGTAYDKCMRDHAGQAGYCDSSGGWHPAE